MHRLFAALPVPEEVSARLIALETDLDGAHWRTAEQHHVTLHFYGEVNADLAEEIAYGLGQIQSPPFALALQGVGWFGRKAPHALYARIAPNPALTRLAQACAKLAGSLRLKSQPEPFLPHITLAYCHNASLTDVMAWSERFQILSSETFAISEFGLYESHMRPGKRAQYSLRAAYRL